MRRGATAVAVALVAVACGTDSASVPQLVTTTLEPAVETVPVRQVDCPDDLRRGDGVALACGVVTVPWDRQGGEAGTTEISVASLAGTDEAVETPVAVLQGGPGGASSDLATWFPRRPFTQVFVDQRGTGFGGPDLDCPEFTAALGEMFESSSADSAVLAAEANATCARRLSGEPLLAHTGSAAHAADVVDVMHALGSDHWIGYGVSYGTTIVLEIMRDAPASFVGAVLDGVYPPDLDADADVVSSASRSLAAVGAACARDADCSDQLGGDELQAVLERVMEDLAADPMLVEIEGDGSGLGDSRTVVLDGPRVAEFVFLMLYQESLTRHLPAVLAGLAQRDAESARWLATNGVRLSVSSQAANHEGAYFAVQCHDRLPFTDGPGDDIDPFAAAVVSTPLADSCAAWPRGSTATATAAPVVSDTPTLLLSGEFDPITPPDHADRAAVGLTRATTVEQAGRGHGIWYGNECIASLVDAFVVDPVGAIDTTCAARPVPVEWAHP